MNPETAILIVIAAVVVIAVCLGIWFAVRRWRSSKLREKFGPEYDYTIQTTGDQHVAEDTLQKREKRVSQLEIRSLTEGEKKRYSDSWTEIQARFVDDPSEAVKASDRLITEMMIARGFPAADFEQRAADLSVLYPEYTSTYRHAYAVASNHRDGRSSTEDLRQAMIAYHALFERLLGVEERNEPIPVRQKEVITQ